MYVCPKLRLYKHKVFVFNYMCKGLVLYVNQLTAIKRFRLKVKVSN